MPKFYPALLPGKLFKSEQLPHPLTLVNSPFPWAEVMKDAAAVLICLRWKICLKEKGTRQHNAVPGEREIQALTLEIHPGWAANTVMIKQFSNNSCTAKQLSALFLEGFVVVCKWCTQQVNLTSLKQYSTTKWIIFSE